MVAREPGNRQWRRLLAVSHYASADAYRKLGRNRAALHAIQAALALRKALAEEAPPDLGAQRDLARATYWLGWIKTKLECPGAAVEPLREAVRLLKAIAAPENNDPPSQDLIAQYQLVLAEQLVGLEDFASALDALLDAAKVRQTCLTPSRTARRRRSPTPKPISSSLRRFTSRMLTTRSPSRDIGSRLN